MIRGSLAPPVWPEGRRFAFTVFDDTDSQTLENGKPVYDMLQELGFRTTKSVWPLESPRPMRLEGSTGADPAYVAWTRELQAVGFEIAYHGASFQTSPRHVTQAGLDRFEELYGHAPRAYANHSRNGEGIYWGDARLSGERRHLYNLLTRFRSAGAFRGHDPSSSLFWGDLCRDRIDYVRDFVFDDVNTLRACPVMPYVDPDRPYVKRWFASSEGSKATSFMRTLSDENQDRLEDEGGACIMYTHFANGFVENGRVIPSFQRTMKRLADKGGWFVPVSTLLDHIVQERGVWLLGRRERMALEYRWLLATIRIRAKARAPR